MSGPSARPDARRVLSRLAAEVPPESTALIQRSGAGGRAVPAASVVLVCEDAEGLQVYLLHRHGRMAFAAGMVALPGGRTERGETARDCAVRETLEETGVELDPDQLHSWSHWITPEFEPRRYDTEFFVAKLPDAAVARDVSGETDRADWARPLDALEQLATGHLHMLPPTQSILLELGDMATWSDVVEASRDRLITPVLPRPVRRDGVWMFDYGSDGPDGS